jgi:hypothetical protein
MSKINPNLQIRSVHLFDGAKQDPMPVPALAPIKPTKASTVHPRSLSTSLECKITGDRSAHGVLAAARDPTTVDRPP